MNEEYVKKALKYWQPYPVAQVRNVVILLCQICSCEVTPPEKARFYAVTHSAFRKLMLCSLAKHNASLAVDWS